MKRFIYQVVLCFCCALALGVGLGLADLLINKPVMTIVICENGAGACDRIKEPMGNRWF